jgi:GGDEF domain-containing protein
VELATLPFFERLRVKTTVATLLKNADIAIYQAKERRNRFRFYSKVVFGYEQ